MSRTPAEAIERLDRIVWARNNSQVPTDQYILMINELVRDYREHGNTLEAIREWAENECS